MSSTIDLKTRWHILSETIRVATSLRESVEDRLTLPLHHPPRTTEPEPIIPECSFSIPPEIWAEISNLQLPARIRDSILQLLHSRLLQRQQAYISAYKRTCLESSRLGFNSGEDFEAILRVNRASAENYYRSMVKEVISFTQAEVAKHENAVDSEVKRFNHEYTPFLAKYFEYNAYPSASHQSVLAEKSTMTRRQIEVWFQNHRNRAKKDDIILRRNASDLPLRVALNILQQSALYPPNRSPSPSDQDSISDDMDEEQYAPQSTSCINAFESFRPQHAFPAAYPPPGPDPFPSDNGVIRFPPPTWARMPASPALTSMKTRASSVDVDNLAGMFHMKLNILEGTKKRVTQKASKAHPPWYAATVTIPSRAPHLAFIQAPSPSSLTILPPSSSTFSFRFPAGSRSKSAAEAFLSPPGQAKTSRKMSPLPRRVPTSFYSTVPSSPTQSSSRASSFYSEYSSRSRSSSSSSRNRTPEPTTPPQVPTLDIPAIHDDFNFSTLFRDDPNLLIATSSGSLGIPQSVDFTADKQPRISLFDFNSLVTLPTPGYIQARS